MKATEERLFYYLKDMEPFHLPSFSDFDAIRQHLDPSFNYLIFEKEEKQVGNIHFGEIRPFLSLIEKAINRQEIFHDESGKRFLLVLEFLPRQKDMIIEKLMDLNLPAGITAFFYSSAL